MKKIIFLFLITASSCKSQFQKDMDHLDSVDRAIKISMIADSLNKQMERKIDFDTVGVSAGPVLILSAKFVSHEYVSARDIRLSWKNVSGKIISAIRFKWYGENAFGEPAKMGRLGNGFGSGESDDELGAGKINSSTWTILSEDGKKIIAAWPFEVAFADGTVWQSTYQK